jgi:acetolactate synthase-1/2/3 large subunit
VLVDIPKDITMQKCEFEYPKDGLDALLQPGGQGPQGQIKKAVQLLLEAKRPMIYAGGGVVLSMRPTADQAGAPARLPDAPTP